MAFLGLLTTAELTAEERPLDWLRALFLLFPNGMAPFTALMGMMGSEPTGDFQYNWFEKGFPTQVIYVNNGGGYLAGATSIAVDDGAGTGAAYEANQGTIVMVQRTGELMILTADPANANTIVVQRGIGSVAAAALNDNDAITLLGAAYEQGSRSPSAISSSMTRKYNYTQIFKKSLEETRSALQTENRAFSNGNYKELKRETLQRFGLDVEKCFLWGERALLTGPTGKPLTTTGGVVSFIPTANKVSFTGTGGVLTETAFENQMEIGFRKGTYERVALCGGVFLKVINQIVNRRWMPTTIEEEYGMKVFTWETAHGIVHFKQHPLFTQHNQWQNCAIFLDFGSGKKRRHMNPTTFRTNVQENDADSRKDFYFADIGGMWPNAETDFMMTDVISFGAA